MRFMRGKRRYIPQLVCSLVIKTAGILLVCTRAVVVFTCDGSSGVDFGIFMYYSKLILLEQSSSIVEPFLNAEALRQEFLCVCVMNAK